MESSERVASADRKDETQPRWPMPVLQIDPIPDHQGSWGEEFLAGRASGEGAGHSSAAP